MFEYFVVQPFAQGNRGGLYALAPVEAQSGAQAVRLAERMASAHAGALAFSRKGDASTGEYEDAEILAVFGECLIEAREDLALAG